MLARAYSEIDRYLKANKVLLIYGPRQVGKTTLVQDYLATSSYRYRLDSGDDLSIQHLLSEARLDQLRTYVEGYDLIVIDEAQQIKGIGQTLKLLIDHIPKLRIIAIGSSSFELAGQVGEPLTGRKTTLTLYPIAQHELHTLYNPFELKQKLETYLIYGAYPEIMMANSLHEKRELAMDMMESYLLKDILEWDKVKSSKQLLHLLRLLAFQIGNEVSHSELATQLGMDRKTVARYIDLLEKTFVIYTLQGYSKNLRKEISKKNKYYYYDNGIRNAVISNFNALTLRNDIGSLWENFIIMERLKKRAYQSIYANDYFWRTWE